MNMISAMKLGAAALALGGLSLLAFGAGSRPAEGQSNLIQDGKIGFVMASFGSALSDSDDATAICPSGTSWGPRDIFAATPEGQRREGETDQDYTRRLGAGGQRVLTAENGQNLCANPEAGAPDPHHPFATGDVASLGIDLDGQVSRANGRAAPGTCAHDDFRGVNGVRGVDNQFLRAVGCTNTLIPGGQQREFDTGMLVGEWGILVALEDVQDLRNDNNVVVKFYANADPIQLSPTREPLANATYAFVQEPQYQSTARGRIVNGVLTTDQVDTRFQYVVASIRLDRVLRHARLRATINADGSMEGILAGYAPVEDMYDVSFGFRNNRLNPDGTRMTTPAATAAAAAAAIAAAGEDAAARQAAARRALGPAGASSGYASTARHTCNGVYYALHQMADGDRDPQTGRCTSISTQYRFRAVPAFIVAAETRSVNDDLERNATRRY